MEFKTNNRGVSIFYLALGICNCVFKVTLVIVIVVLSKQLR